MTKMNCILCLMKDGVQTDFERFKEKTLRGVLNQYRVLNRGYGMGWLVFNDYIKADFIEIYKTPDHYTHTDSDLLYKATPADFFKDIGL